MAKITKLIVGKGVSAESLDQKGWTRLYYEIEVAIDDMSELELAKANALGMLDAWIAGVAKPIPKSINEFKTEASQPTWKEVVPLKSRDDKLLGTFYIGVDQLRIVPASDLKLKTATPPLQVFLVNRVLAPMKKKDESENITLGISWTINEENGVLKEILIRDFGNDQRLKELRTACRWCLEKMAEKSQ